MGAASLIGYRMVKNNFSPNKAQSDLRLKLDKIKTDVSSKNKFVSDDNNTTSSSENKNCLSDLYIEQLQLDYYLQIVILYLLILVLIFLVIKFKVINILIILIIYLLIIT